MEETRRPDANGEFPLVPSFDSDGRRTCHRCDIPMEPSELRFPIARMIGRIGSPPPPARVLPTWRCHQCGMQQPRIES